MSPDPDYDRISDAEMSRHMMPRLAVPDCDRWLEDGLALSQNLRARVSGDRDERYGEGPRQVADLFPATQPGAPIVLFLHGGYWRALSKDHFSYIAGPLREAGAAVVLPNYDLCPSVPLQTVVAQAKQALLWTRRQAARLNGDPDRIYVAGNSAGAHLAAMLLAEDWTHHGLARSPIAGAILVTGVYDLRFVPRVPVNEEIRLKPSETRDLSPLFLPLCARVPTLVAVGADEPALWIDLSKRYADMASAAGASVTYMELPGLHHFSITHSLADRSAPLTRAVLELVRR